MTTEETIKILCPFCSAPYTANMEMELEDGGGCESCGPGSPTGTLIIKCSNCKKVVYKKEYV